MSGIGLIWRAALLPPAVPAPGLMLLSEHLLLLLLLLLLLPVIQLMLVPVLANVSLSA